MYIVVVLHFAMIALEDPAYEVSQLSLVQLQEDLRVELLKDVKGQSRCGLAPLYVSTELQSVEVDVINFAKMLAMLLNEFIDRVQTWHPLHMAIQTFLRVSLLHIYITFPQTVLSEGDDSLSREFLQPSTGQSRSSLVY